MRRIIDQWNTKTVGGQTEKLSHSDFAKVADSVHLMQDQLSTLQVIDLIGRVTGNAPDGRPIGGTGKIENWSQSVSNGTTYDVWTPNAGEVWNFMGAGYTATVGSGTLDAIQIKISDGTNEVMVAENLNDSYDGLVRFSEPLYVDENLTIRVRCSDASVSALDLNLLLIRIR